MKKQLVIAGNGSYAKMMKEYIRMDHSGVIDAFVVDKEYIHQKDIDGTPVLSFQEFRETYDKDETGLIMGIGYTQMGTVRKKIFERCKYWGYHFENYIHPTAIVEQNVKLGEGNNILEGVILETGVIIGNANLFFGGVLIGHESTVGDFNTFSVKSCIAGCVSVKNNNFLGISSAVRDHVVIHDFVLLGATAYAFKDIDAYSVVKPAKCSIITDRISTDYL